MLNLRKCRVGVVGLGYVGLPLAVEFGKHFDTVGFVIVGATIITIVMMVLLTRRAGANTSPGTKAGAPA